MSAFEIVISCSAAGGMEPAIPLASPVGDDDTLRNIQEDLMKSASHISLVALTVSACGSMAMGCVGQGGAPEAGESAEIAEASSPLSAFPPPIDPNVKPGEARIRAADGSVTNLCLDIDASAPSPAPVIAWPCNGGKNQQWFYHQESHRISSGLVEAPGKALCLEVRDRTPGTNRPDAVGSPIVAKPCFPGTHYTGTPSGQSWRFHADGTIAVLSDGLQPLGTCLDLFQAHYAPGTPLVTWTCTGSANQRFAYNYGLDTIVRAPSLKPLSAFADPMYEEAIDHFNVLLFGVPNPAKGLRDFYDVDAVGFNSGWLGTVTTAHVPIGMDTLGFDIVKHYYSIELRAVGNLRHFVAQGETFGDALLLNHASRLATVEAKLAMSQATHVGIDLGAIMAQGLPKVAAAHPSSKAAMELLRSITDHVAKERGGHLRVDATLADFDAALSHAIEDVMAELHASANEIGQDYDKVRAFNELVDRGEVQWPPHDLTPLADEYEIGLWKSALHTAGYVVNENTCAYSAGDPCRIPSNPQPQGAYQLMKREQRSNVDLFAEHHDICEHIDTLGTDTMRQLLLRQEGWDLPETEWRNEYGGGCYGDQEHSLFL